jgi:prepilin-type N-terminal cleavage/methylation domain-containing protein
MRERGFTLVELMMVVAMIGILAAVAVAGFDTRTRPVDGAQVMAGMIRETARQAVQRGEVSAELAEVAGTSAPARLVLVENDDATVTMTIQALVDDGGMPGWLTVTTRTVGPTLHLAGTSPRAELDDGTSPVRTLSPGARVTIECEALGVCDAITVYFTGARNAKARTAVLPLGGAPVPVQSW